MVIHRLIHTCFVACICRNAQCPARASQRPTANRVGRYAGDTQRAGLIDMSCLDAMTYEHRSHHPHTTDNGAGTRHRSAYAFPFGRFATVAITVGIAASESNAVQMMTSFGEPVSIM